MNIMQITMTERLAGQRRDKALSEASELSRSYVQQLLSEGLVQLDGAVISNASAKVKAGETYTLQIPDVVPLALEPVAMALRIVYEDDALLVIDKPAGLTVHPAPGTHEPTLVHGLLAHCGESLSGIGGVARPGIVHRLDKDTSGLMVVAKTDAAHQHLGAQLKDRSLSRIYQAVCWGVPMPPQGVIDAPIGRHPKDRTRMAVVTRGGKPARTHYRILRVLPSPTGGEKKQAVASHIECQLESGRTHQIRVHLNHLGHGLIGDPLYGRSTHNRLHQYDINEPEETIQFLSDYRQQALHATNIMFTHPISGEVVQYNSPLPERMTLLLSCLNHLQNSD